jgi:hypothetical protein
MMPSFRRLRYRAARTRLNVPLIWLRHRGLDSADVFLASYPRSGQHWTRFQLFEIMNHTCADFESIERVIPKLGAHGAAPAILPSGGRLVQTHHPWRKEYQRAVYLVRDVRDVVLSVYAGEASLGLTRHFDITDFDGYLLPWLQGKLQIMSNWQNHVISWLESPLARNGNLLIVRFEDMRHHTEAVLRRMLEFLGVPFTTTSIRDAIANNSIEKMRAKEDSSMRFDPRTLGRKSGEEYRFVRTGTVGGWRAKLTKAQVQLIELYTGKALARIGYEFGPSLLREAAGVPGSRSVD